MDSLSFLEGYKSALRATIVVLESPENLSSAEVLKAVQIALSVIERDV